MKCLSSKRVYVGNERRESAHKYQDPGPGIRLEARDKELLLPVNLVSLTVSLKSTFSSA